MENLLDSLADCWMSFAQYFQEISGELTTIINSAVSPREKVSMTLHALRNSSEDISVSKIISFLKLEVESVNSQVKSVKIESPIVSPKKGNFRAFN